MAKICTLSGLISLEIKVEDGTWTFEHEFLKKLLISNKETHLAVTVCLLSHGFSHCQNCRKHEWISITLPTQLPYVKHMKSTHCFHCSHTEGKLGNICHIDKIYSLSVESWFAVWLWLSASSLSAASGGNHYSVRHVWYIESRAPTLSRRIDRMKMKFHFKFAALALQFNWKGSWSCF